MINVSNKFFQTMEKRRNFTGYANVTLADGTTLTLSENEFTLDNNSITESAGSTGLPLGEAICRTVQIEIINPNDRYSDYDFVGAKIDLELRFWLDGETESFNIGKFTVIYPHTYGETIIITAVDDMYRAEEYYSTKMDFPATIGAVLADVCSTCGIELKTTSFLNDNFTLQSRPSGNYIVRNLIGYIAMIAGGNARINRNNELEIISYDFSALEDIAVIGGTFNPWTGGDTLSGGTLNPWTSGDELSGGNLIGKTDYHLLRNFKTLKVDTDEIEITGISMRVENDIGVQDLISGTEGYVINVENPLLRDREEEGLALIASVLVGGKMRRFEGDHIAYPLAEFMDPCVVVDKKGNMYPTILTDIDFEFFGYTNLKNTAQSKEEIKPKKSTKFRDELVRIEQKAEDLVEAEKTAREEAIKNLNTTLGDSSGMYVSDVEQTDGSTIRYLHDKPALVDSKNVIKITAEAIGFSNDGGATFPYGLTLNGETITKYLYAEGIDADYIIVGRISDSTGQNYWNLETGDMVINKATINGELISVKVTADQLTTGRITDSTGDNYWDLDTGTMKIGNATIENIDADSIETGRIADKKGNNYWDMDSGEMVINKATINTQLNADKITTGTLSADRIDIDELFSQEITATNLTLTGSSKFVSSVAQGSEITIQDGRLRLELNDGSSNVTEHSGYGSTYYAGVFATDDDYTRVGGSGVTLYPNEKSTFMRFAIQKPGAGPSNVESNRAISISHDKLYGYDSATLDWRGPVKFSNSTLADFIVEQGTVGAFSYEKWNTGRLEVYGNILVENMSINTAIGSFYRNADIQSLSNYKYPVAFAYNPTVNMSFSTNNSKGAFVWITSATHKTYPPDYYLMRPTVETGVTGNLNIVAKGRWK